MNANVIRDGCEALWKQECQQLKEHYTDITFQVLSIEQITLLADKICALPVEYQSILTLYYVFNEGFDDLNFLLGIEDSAGQLCYIHRLLSVLMGMKDAWIAPAMLEKACMMAQEQINELTAFEGNDKHIYSEKIKRKLKKINIKSDNERIYTVVLKRIAVCFLLVLLGVALIPSARSRAWEIIKEWMVEVFPEFTIFTKPEQGLSENAVDLQSIAIGYVPNGFALEKKSEDAEIYVYSYKDIQGKVLTIKLVVSEVSNRSYYDTEDAEVQIVDFKGNSAYVWETDARSYLLWNEDGIDYHVSGQIVMEEMWKIAQNIRKKDIRKK